MEESLINNKEYIIGNLILYVSNDSSEEIVDGQQRLITLSLILYVLGDNRLSFLYEKVDALSEKRIYENCEIIENYFCNYTNGEDFKRFVKENVFMTYMKTNDLDEAFILFDSQNTRGKPLKRKDILKVHHIHPIVENRLIYAKRWEKWENEIEDNNEMDKLDELLYLISVIRKGVKGELVGNDLNEIDVFKELKSTINRYELNNYVQPALFEEFHFDFENDTLQFTTKPLKTGNCLITNGHIYLPFQVHSSIAKGKMFFAFVFKCFSLFSELRSKEVFRAIDNVYGKGNSYLRKIYKNVLLLYADKFGFDKLKRFAEMVFVLLSYFRVIKDSLRADGLVKFKWNDNDRLDLFKEIIFSFSKDELFAKIMEYIRFKINKDEFSGNFKGTKWDFVKDNECFRLEEILKSISKDEKK